MEKKQEFRNCVTEPHLKFDLRRPLTLSEFPAIILSHINSLRSQSHKKGKMKQLFTSHLIPFHLFSVVSSSSFACRTLINTLTL